MSRFVSVSPLAVLNLEAGSEISAANAPGPPAGGPPAGLFTSPPPMALVVFAGQSNALGFGMTPDSVAGRYQIDPLTYIWNAEQGHYEIMQPGVNTGTPTNPGAWGPEVGFAQTFRAEHPTEALFIVKSVKGSTGLEADPDRLDWSPHSKGELFDATTAEVAAARAQLGNLPVDAVFLVQGEQDAFSEQAAQDYGANMADWLSAIRRDWMQDPDGRIGFARIADSTPYYETVRWAQYMTDQQDPLAASFDTWDYHMQADKLHYAADGFLQMGQTFASLFDAWA